MSTTKTKQKTYGVSFKMTGDFTIDIKAASLEEAITKGRELGLGKALNQHGNSSWNDFYGHISSVWETS